MNTRRRTMVPERHRGEFTTTVHAKCTKLRPSLHFDSSLESLDGLCHFMLVGEKDCPHVPCHVVDEQEYVALATIRCRGDGPADIPVDDIDAALCPANCHLWEWASTLFLSKAGVPELLRVV